MAHLGLFGGSGLYGLPLDGAEWRDVPTPWGAPSDQILSGTLDGVPVGFLRGHVHAPVELPSTANIAALTLIGVVPISAVGSFREETARERRDILHVERLRAPAGPVP